jgi:DNA-binding IclR family transcriptional regulator
VKSTPPLEAVGKIVQVIENFCGQSTEWGVRELAAHTGIPKSTVHRVLNTLTTVGWLSYDEKLQRYKVGMELYRISTVLANRMPTVQMARPYLEAIAKETGESVILSIFEKEDYQLFFTDKVESSHSLRYSFQLGVPMEMYHGAAGKCIMAYLPEHEQQEILAGIRPDAGKKPIDKSALMEDLRETRRRGYSISYGERIPDAVSVASPFWGISGLMGAITLTVPEYRVQSPEQIQNWSKLIIRETGSLTVNLGGTSVKGVDRIEANQF